MTREEFGLRFARAREDTGLTQAEAAEVLGVSRPRITEYESGLRIPPVTRLVEIVTALGLEPRTLFPEFFEED